MKPYQRDFIDLAIARGALRFGEFELKSGRTSPYFFNAGVFCRGDDLVVLGRCYAQAILEAGLDFDLLFGPAYKGIPLAACTALTLADKHDKPVPYCFNRKEAKTHGEGGSLVGAPLSGRVVVVDDVITAGTAIREVLTIIDNSEAEAVAAVVGLDRKERGGESALSAVQEVEKQFGLQVVSIVDIDDIICYLEESGAREAELESVMAYRSQYGVGHFEKA